MKYQSGAFGRCPRIYCQGQAVLPVGLSDVPRNCTVAVYCPRCQDIFHPKSTRYAVQNAVTCCHISIMLRCCVGTSSISTGNSITDVVVRCMILTLQRHSAAGSKITAPHCSCVHAQSVYIPSACMLALATLSNSQCVIAVNMHHHWCLSVMLIQAGRPI
jgi:Casein kinase II regulatory subunit